METFKTWWEDLKNEYSYGEPTAEDIGRKLWKLTLKTQKEPVAKLQCSDGLEGLSEYEINCAMGVILNSSRNLHYWFMAKNKEDMKTNLKLLKKGVERLEKELAD